MGFISLCFIVGAALGSDRDRRHGERGSATHEDTAGEFFQFLHDSWGLQIFTWVEC